MVSTVKTLNCQRKNTRSCLSLNRESTHTRTDASQQLKVPGNQPDTTASPSAVLWPQEWRDEAAVKGGWVTIGKSCLQP